MSSTLKIKKRDGTSADFDSNKIVLALEKAFVAVRGVNNPSKVQLISDRVSVQLEQLFEGKLPAVENVQDLVERELMQEGFFDVAKAYILYRYEHTKERTEKKKQLLEKIEANALMIIKRSGQKELFSEAKLRRSLGFAARGLESSVDIEIIISQCRSELYEGMTTADLKKALIMTVRAMIEQDPAYDKVTARLLLYSNYKDVIGADTIDFQSLDTQYRTAFVKNLKRGVELGRLDPKLLAFDLDKLSASLVIERDDLFLYLGLQTLTDRYFIADHDTKQTLETPQMFWMRIAMGAALNEKNKFEHTIKFYDIMSKLLYTPSTPTLFHAGTVKPQLSS
ncbi:MAG: ATP cone domain-containing protein [Patescibacteria group bacterium]